MKPNPIEIAHILHGTPVDTPFPPASDRRIWGSGVLPDEDTAVILRAAEAAAGTPPAVLPASVYLEVKRTAQRESYETRANQREANLTSLVLAECLEYRGRFQDAILDYAWAICEESSWAWPAHQYDLADMENPVIDLIAAAKGWLLAEVDMLLGDTLDPMLRQRIRYEVNRRLFVPYLERNDFWWMYDTADRPANNWTAVCNAGVISAALYLETDHNRLAAMIYKALGSLQDYLNTFDRDGGSSEGPGYWAYGFGNYVMLAHLLEQRTNGHIKLMDDDRIYNIARFPLRTRLSPGFYVNFSDSSPHAEIPAHVLGYLAERLNLPALRGLIAEQPTSPSRYQWLTTALREIFWLVEADTPAQPEKRDWFSEMMWFITRHDPANPDGLVLAAKGGHNHEMHNQNDIGSFIVHYNGESLIAELGAARYTRDYFNDQRYTFFVAQSGSHSCPIPNDQQQAQGREHTAQLLNLETSDTADTITFELKDAYPPDTDIESLKRTLTLHRDRSQVELIDKITYVTRPHKFESVLITLGHVEIEAGSVQIIGERGHLHITYDPDVVHPRLEMVEQVDLASGMTDIGRIIFALSNPAQTAKVHLVITPSIRA